MRVLLRVAHGSRLYGTAVAGSDHDWYEVTETARAGNPWTTRYGASEQVLEGSQDVVRKDLGQWMREVAGGVPQACEAAWAAPRFAEVDLIRELRLGLRVGTAGWPRHRRAMAQFAAGYWDGGHKGDWVAYAAKRAKHAVRLAWNLRELRESGWYDPTMTAERVEWCRRAAANLGSGAELLKTCDSIALGDTIEW